MTLLEAKIRLINELKSMGIKDKNVLHAMEITKRELFVRNNDIMDAYKNHPLSIGHRQTISQPYTVAYMIELLDIRPNNKILEIGAGSGYNAAVMSYLAKKIYAIELEDKLCGFARKNLKKSGIENVEIISGDGYHGYEKEAPYDRIIITAASPDIPEPLINQLAPNGIMVLPIKKFYSEVMTKIVKKKKLEITKHGDFAFVPLRRQ